MAAPRTATRQAPGVELPVERFVLKCGAGLLVSRRPAAPVTAMQLHVRGGHGLDPKGLEGLSYLTGALADQGTRSHSEEELAERLEVAGGSLAGDSSGLSGSVASAAWPTLAEVLCEVVTEPTYPAVQVRRQRQRLLDRLLLERDDPRAQGGLKFRRLVYGEHWLGRSAYGTRESVARIDGPKLRAHQRANWVPARALFAVCGDVEPEQVRRLFDRRLARWKPGTAYREQQPRFPEPGVRVDVFEAQREQVHVYLGHLGVRRSDPDYPALAVMDHVLGTGPGFTNRISKRLRDELGLAYTVHANIHASSGLLPGRFSAYIGTSPQHVRTAIEGFLEEIRRIQREPVGVDELRVAQDYLVGAFALSFQRAARRVSYMTTAERLKLPADNLESLPRAFAAVTPADVQRAAKAHLFPSRCCVAAAGPVDRRELERVVRRASKG